MKRILFIACLLLGAVLAPLARQTTEFWIDSDVLTGSHNGTPANPACSYYSIIAPIMAQLNAGVDVTVHWSAREAASDVDDPYTGNSSGTCSGGGGSAGRIDMLSFRGKTGSARLTFDFNRYYNANDGEPSWLPYSGPSKAQVISIFSQSAGHIKINDVTIDGVRAVGRSEKAISICGDNWIVRNSDISHVPASRNGPLLLIVPTADGSHEGSSEYCPPMTNLLIENNVIHDSWGELIYLGGAGCIVRDPLGTPVNCMGFPAHDNITIRNNDIYNGGVSGGQGDGIDIKAGITNLTIARNRIHNTGPVTRAIVMQGQNANGPDQNVMIEDNDIRDNPVEDAAIVCADTWGTCRGVTIRNNVVENSGTPVKLYGGTNVVVSNNIPGPPNPAAGPVPVAPPPAPVDPPPAPVDPPPNPVDPPPVPGNGGLLRLSLLSPSALMLNWTLADEPAFYEVRRSNFDDMGTIADAEANGTVVKVYTANIDECKVLKLTSSGKDYYLTVIAKDSKDQKAIYQTVRTGTTGSRIVEDP